jgi:hypothetical protein
MAVADWIEEARAAREAGDLKKALKLLDDARYPLVLAGDVDGLRILQNEAQFISAVAAGRYRKNAERLAKTAAANLGRAQTIATAAEQWSTQRGSRSRRRQCRRLR